ncbi:uncharacterized protein V2V93DRAFT_380561 [Kockiozyma suomiensis]|uniref:uncharacterized protein n=1 Tax=Kockiozyma suomiensis TaxID=1337062 RepID=UPI00334307E0
MKFFIYLTILVTLIVGCLAGKDDKGDDKGSNDPPYCTGLCVFGSLDKAKCDPLTIECLCTSKPFAKALIACVLESCPWKDYAPSVKYLTNTCGPTWGDELDNIFHF